MDRSSIKFVQKLLFSRTETEEEFLEKVRNGEEVEIPIFRTGSYIYRRGKEPKKVSFSRGYLEKIVDNHNKRVVAEQISFDQDHKSDEGATFWVADKGLSIREVQMLLPNGKTSEVSILFSRGTFSDKGKELVLGKQYKYFSSEIDENFSTSEVYLVEEEGKKKEGLLKYGPALVGGGLTNRPFIPHLPALYSNNLNGVEESDLISTSTIDDEDGNTYGSFIFSAETMSDIDVPEEVVIEEVRDETSDKIEPLENPTSIGFNKQTELDSSPEVPKEDQGMKFKQIRTQILTFSSPEDKRDYLSKVDRAELTEPEIEMLDMLVEAQETSIKASREAQANLEKAAQLQSQLEETSARFEEAEKSLKEAHAQKFESKLLAFSTVLSKDRHHKPAIDAAVAILRGLGGDAQTMKFSVAEGQEVDLFGALESIFAALPEGARLDESENLQANKINLDIEEEEPTEGGDDEIPDRIKKYSSKYNVSISEAKRLDGGGLVDENGNYKYSK